MVLGAGYVGLVTAAFLVEQGLSVTIVEPDDRRREALQRGETPIAERGLLPLIRDAVADGRLTATNDAAAALSACTMVIVAVGTPQADDGRVDLRSLDGAVEGLRESVAPGTVVVIKSTVPPGTAVRVRTELAEREGVSVVSCPEFLREGSALHDVHHAARVVIGGDDPAAVARVRRLMEVPGAEVVLCDNMSAELIKYASNAFLALKISFINEVANLCEAIDADVATVAHGVGLDPRIGPAFLNAGLGFGGSCFPKDVRGLDATASRNGYSFWMLKAALEVNEQQRMRFIQKIRDAVGNHLASRRIALLGLAFKPGTDDMRQAPSIDIAMRLRELGAEVVAHDPVAMENARPHLEGVILAPDVESAVTGADAIAIITEWPEYRALDWSALRGLVRRPVVVDGRNCLDAAAVSAAGFNYWSVGRLPVVTAWERRHADRDDVESGGDVA